MGFQIELSIIGYAQEGAVFPKANATRAPRYLPDDVEVMLAAWLVANAEIGHPVLKPALFILAFTIAKDLGTNVKPGSCMKGWFRRFLERTNSELHCEDNGIDIPKLKIRTKA